MRALARKASKLAIYGAAGLCAQKSGASDKILKLCRDSSLAAKIGAGGLVCATPLVLKLGAGVALKFAARKILTLGICELSKSAALKCVKLGAGAVVRSFSRTDKFTDERTKKHASADGESSKASITPRRKRTASVSSASIKKDAPLSKNVSAKKNTAINNSLLAKKAVPTAKTALTAKNIAAGAAPISVTKSASVAKSVSAKNATQNKISALSAKVAPTKSASQNAKSHRVAKNTATPTAAAAKDVAATTASSAPTAKQSRRAAKSAPFKSSVAGKS